MSGDTAPLVERLPSDGRDEEERRISNGQQANGREIHSGIGFCPEGAIDAGNFFGTTQDIPEEQDATDTNTPNSMEALELTRELQMELQTFLPFKDEDTSSLFKTNPTPARSQVEATEILNIDTEQLHALLCSDFTDERQWLDEANSLLWIKKPIGESEIEYVAEQLKKIVWEKCKPPEGQDLFWILKPNLTALSGSSSGAPSSLNIFSVRALFGAALHEHGRQVADMSAHGVFPIHLAAESHCLDALFYLLSWHVNAKQQTLYARKTALHHAVRFRATENSREQQKTIIMVLTKKFHLSHSMQDSGGHLPLFNAILTKDADLVEHLIDQYHPYINHADADEDTHLHVAAEINCPEIVCLLIKNGADPKLCNKDQQTPSHIAAQKPKACLSAMNQECKVKKLELVGTFLQEDSLGKTPLDYAALHNQEETFRYIWDCFCAEPSPSITSYREVLARLSRTAREDNCFATVQYTLESIPKPVIQSVMTVDSEEQGSVAASFCSLLKSTKNAPIGVVTPVVTTVLSKCLYGETAVISKVLDSDEDGRYPPKSDYDRTLRHCVLFNGAIWCHPTMRIWINRKWSQFGEWIVRIFAFLYVLQMLALTTALSLAVRPGVTEETLNLYNTPLDQFRGFMEGVVILMWMTKIVNEAQKFIILRKIYFRDLFMYINFSAIVLVVFTIVLRIAQSNVQWAFAALAYLTYSMLALEYFSLMTWSSTYVQTLLIIAKRDLTKFMAVFLVYLVGFSGAFLLAVQVDRTYSSGIVQNGGGSSGDSSDNSTLGIWNTIYLGFRVMLEGGSVIDYNGKLGWLAVLFYVGFLMIIVLIMLNVLIAQMTDTYARVRLNARALATFHRARFLLRYLCIYEKWWPKREGYWKGKVIIWTGQNMPSAKNLYFKVKQFVQSLFLEDAIALRESDSDISLKRETVTNYDMEVMLEKLRKSVQDELKVLKLDIRDSRTATSNGGASHRRSRPASGI